MHEVLVNRLGGLSLPRKSVVRLPDRPDMTLDVYRGRKTTMHHHARFVKIFWFQGEALSLVLLLSIFSIHLNLHQLKIGRHLSL